VRFVHFCTLCADVAKQCPNLRVPALTVFSRLTAEIDDLAMVCFICAAVCEALPMVLHLAFRLMPSICSMCVV